DLAAFAQDPEGSKLLFRITGSTGGTVRLSDDGHTLWFEPQGTTAGTVSFVADDGHSASPAATITINVSSAALLRVNLNNQNIRLDIGSVERLVVTGDFADQTGVP